MTKGYMSVDQRLKVIQAAAKCFDAKGVKRTTYADIAKASGVDAEPIKSEFKNKNLLALAVQTMRLELLKKEYLANMPDATPRDTVKFIMRKRVEFVGNNKMRTYLFFINALQNKKPWSSILDQLIWQLSVEFASIVERGVREGNYKQDTDVNVAVRTLTSIYLTSLVTIGLRGEPFDVEVVWNFIEPQVDLVFDSMQK